MKTSELTGPALDWIDPSPSTRTETTEREKQLDQLLFAVQSKVPGETRFETALRYIRRMEEPSEDAEGRTHDQERM
jgi:hypothetical protein